MNYIISILLIFQITIGQSFAFQAKIRTVPDFCLAAVSIYNQRQDEERRRYMDSDDESDYEDEIVKREYNEVDLERIAEIADAHFKYKTKLEKYVGIRFEELPRVTQDFLIYFENYGNKFDDLENFLKYLKGLERDNLNKSETGVKQEKYIKDLFNKSIPRLVSVCQNYGVNVVCDEWKNFQELGELSGKHVFLFFQKALPKFITEYGEDFVVDNMGKLMNLARASYNEKDPHKEAKLYNLFSRVLPKLHKTFESEYEPCLTESDTDDEDDSLEENFLIENWDQFVEICVDAGAFRSRDNLKLLEILTRADLDAISGKKGEFYKKFKNAFEEKNLPKLKEALRQINDTGIWVGQTNIENLLQAADDIEGVQVLNLTVLSKAVLERLSFFMHAIKRDKLRENLKVFIHKDIYSNPLRMFLSVTYGALNNLRTFLGGIKGDKFDDDEGVSEEGIQQGLIIKVRDTNDIIFASKKDIDSKDRKDFSHIVNFLYKVYRDFEGKGVRDGHAKNLKNIFGIENDEGYIEFLDELRRNFSDFEDIKDSYDFKTINETGASFKEKMKRFIKEELLNDEEWNEFCVTGLDVVGVFYKISDLSLSQSEMMAEVPQELKDFAKKQGLPLLLLPESKPLTSLALEVARFIKNLLQDKEEELDLGSIINLHVRLNAAA